MPSEVCRDDARVQTVGRFAGACESARELSGEKNVREFGLAIVAPGCVPSFAREVIEFDSVFGSSSVRVARHDNDATVVGKFVEQVCHEQEMADMVRKELQLVSVLLFELGKGHDSRIANDGVNRFIECGHRFDTRAD